MLKKMRRRVICAAMLAFFSVIVVIAVLVNIVNYFVETKRADETLTYIAGFEEREAPGERPPDKPGRGQGPGPGPGDNGPPSFRELPDVEANYMTRFFIVRFREDGTASSAFTDFIASIDEKEAINYAQQILKKGKTHGYYKEYRYLNTKINGRRVVVFLNSIREIQYMRSLRILTIIIAEISLIALFPLVYLFSGKAIKPIVRNVEMQKQFITDAGHELKTPITSISTSLEVLTMEHGEDEWTDNIKNQIGRLSKLVHELVALSKMDEATPFNEKEHFSLSDMLWEVVEVYQPQIKASGKTLNTNIGEDIAILGDKAAMEQMVSVLLDNAVRYSSPESEIRLSLTKKKSHTVLEVFNKCNYETPPDEEKLFDRFYRPDESRSSESGGSGIGLAIAKAVAETHGGTIEARCPDGKDMTITVIL